MTAATLWYGLAHKKAYESMLALGTPKVMLVTATHTPNQDTHDFINDANANEGSGTGYSAGGVTLASVAVSYDTATNKVKIDADDVSGISVSARWAIVYVDTGTAATSPVISYTDLSEGVGGNVTVTGIAWGAGGIVDVTVS